jgi:hypothetical protein
LAWGREVSGMSIKTIITTSIGLLVIAVLVPIGFQNIFDTDTTGWDTAVCALWFIIPIAICVMFIYKYFTRATK